MRVYLIRVPELGLYAEVLCSTPVGAICMYGTLIQHTRDPHKEITTVWDPRHATSSHPLALSLSLSLRLSRCTLLHNECQAASVWQLEADE